MCWWIYIRNKVSSVFNKSSIHLLKAEVVNYVVAEEFEKVREQF